MKYMTFNRSCSYACLANMLLDFSIDTEDYKIIYESNIPYMFQYDEREDLFVAGPSLQGKQWFDYYLNTVELEFKEIVISVNEILEFLETVSNRCMLGLKIGNIGKHALIFEGIENNKYKFLNVRRKDSLEPNYYWFSSQELISRLDETIQIGWIEKLSNEKKINYKDEMILSLDHLQIFREKLIDFCSKEQDFSSLEKAKFSLFEAFFLDIVSMMEILNHFEIANEIKMVRNQFIQALKLKRGLTLSDYMSMDKLDEVIIRYSKLIKNKTNSSI